MKRKSGFTIIELLIVIVVIAVLAAITIVAYNGIQVRAENTKTVAGVNQAVKLLLAYKAINGDFPVNGLACIGTGYASDTCMTATDGVTPSAINSSSFNNALTSVGSLPTLSTKNLTLSSGQVVAGANWNYSDKMIRYHLAGSSTTCDAGGSKYTYGNVIQCRIVLE